MVVTGQPLQNVLTMNADYDGPYTLSCSQTHTVCIHKTDYITDVPFYDGSVALTDPIIDAT